MYARVSTTRQAQAQTIEQQLDQLRTAVAERGWELEDQHVYRDDGFSGARLGRPGLDRLRDHAALADLDVVLVAAPDRLARNYVHQVLLIEGWRLKADGSALAPGLRHSALIVIQKRQFDRCGEAFA